MPLLHRAGNLRSWRVTRELSSRQTEWSRPFVGCTEQAFAQACALWRCCNSVALRERADLDLSSEELNGRAIDAGGNRRQGSARSYNTTGKNLGGQLSFRVHDKNCEETG